jgi:phospholipid-translocating ATPase
LVNLKLALNTQFWTVLTWTAYLLTSIGAYFSWMWVSDNIPGVVVYQTAVVLFESPLFYFCVTISILSMFSLDLLLFSFKISKDNLLNYYKRIVRTEEEGD